MSIGNLQSLCVDGFPFTRTREDIMGALMSILSRLDDLGIHAEVWIDGSFLTKKDDPNDVDYVVVLNWFGGGRGSTVKGIAVVATGEVQHV